jgi:hypothetical protein
MDGLKFYGEVTTRYKNPVTGEYIPGSEQTDRNMVVDTGAVEIVKWLANATPAAAGIFKYVGIGSTATAAAHGQTALLAEYSAGGYTRITGTQSVQAESGNGNKVYQVVAEFPVEATRTAVAEMGLFNSATPAGSIMMVRLVFSPTRDNANNTLEITYKLTVAPA